MRALMVAGLALAAGCTGGGSGGGGAEAGLPFQGQPGESEDGAPRCNIADWCQGTWVVTSVTSDRASACYTPTEPTENGVYACLPQQMTAAIGGRDCVPYSEAEAIVAALPVAPWSYTKDGESKVAQRGFSDTLEWTVGCLGTFAYNVTIAGEGSYEYDENTGAQLSFTPAE